ncbi:MAG: protein kinase [Geminicoccaceae bacterium]|nr:protein kinase [Geminicoccaceae bacterium]
MNAVAERYTLTSELGRGGMATVHRAHDARHGRDVAVKVMLPAIAESLGAERFLREIETAARLQHPHIVPVFDSGNVDGQLFFVMPLIEGESLRGKLQREGRLDVEEAVRIVREVADALEYAHSEGVVHRDLKPENILMSRGHALLADFGIARAAKSQADVALTQAGISLGTPSYMSPELAAGETDVGPTSDVYALGCILFELLTGSPPFTGNSYQAILVKRFTMDAPRVRTLRPGVPAAYDDAIARSLARDPAHRTPTARAFADVLAAGAAPRAAATHDTTFGDRSIVVLPFDNLSPDPNDAYLADGLTEELIADLSRVKALRVIARNSSAAAYQRTKNLKEISRMLDVRYLLEGSVRRAGKALRITAQLIDGTTDAHLWADKYGGTIDEVFEMQERISRSIVEELRARLTPHEEANRAAPVTDPETYELYLRAKHMLGQSLMRIPEATPLLEEVMRRDPRFAPAYTALGAPLVLFAMFNYIQPKAAWEQIQSLADRALAANPRSGPAHELLAAVATYRDWNWQEARRLYEKAAELEPGAGFDRFLYAFFLAFSGDVQGGLQSARRGRRLDPLSFLGFLTESVMLAWTGDFDAALPLAMRPIELDPQFPEGYHIAGYVLLGQKHYARAAEILTQALAPSHRGAWPMAKLGVALVNLGRRDEAHALLAELEQRAHEATMSAPAVATLQLHLGNREEFYRWINRGIDERDPFALSLGQEFLWDPVRHEPEFQTLLRRVGLA